VGDSALSGPTWGGMSTWMDDRLGTPVADSF
jgi:hypothetical protein